MAPTPSLQYRPMRRLITLALLLGWTALAAASARAEEAEPEQPASEEPSPYVETEPVIAPAPAQAAATPLLAGAKLVDLAASPVGPEVAALIAGADGAQTLLLWRIGGGEPSRLAVPREAALNSLAWRPTGDRLFVAGRNGVFAIDPREPQWRPRPLWLPKQPVERILAGPRPFLPGYRLFFTQQQADGKRAIGSVNERGEKFYLVTSPTAAAPKGDAEENPEAPATERLADVRPIGFHPAGAVMLLADAKGCFLKKPYDRENWAKAEPLKDCGGHMAYAPNGAALLRWRSDRQGVEIIDLVSGARRAEAAAVAFVAAPAFTPDGKGVVGAAKGADGALDLRYQPIDLPLADVINAWMFLESTADQKQFAAHGGLFRPFEGEQLYKLYDTENYSCGGYDKSSPARPYFVTTDILWEVYAAAYEGVFMTAERQQAMPAFRRLVEGASRELAAGAQGGRMAGAFAAAAAVIAGKPGANAEAAKIIAGAEAGDSAVLGEPVDYRVFAPRGHYTKDEEAKAYFRAVRYLGSVKLAAGDLAALGALSPQTRTAALAWVSVYRAFIAPSRAPLAWDSGRPPAPYASRPQREPRLFPLSWGWDNEVFDAAVHHEDRPLAGPGGPRLLPSGLDLAAALGSPLADSVLAEIGQFDAYPELKARLAEQGARFRTGAAEEGDNLYARWLRALAVQWAANAAAPISGPLWDAKRLQTGLASWATLRHATVLVNDLASAECGEAGFEAIVMRPPRGAVEPDPAAFSAIAGLFDATIGVVRGVWPKGDALGEGVVRRLEQSRDQARHFGSIADKEIRGEPLSARDYEDILYVGRAAEHNFLVFYSLTAEENALSTPDPVAKIAEVAGGGATGWLEAAVGAPLEWDQIVPSFGRREIVKGVVYGYHEFTSDHPLTDEDWRARAAREPRPAWIAPYVSRHSLSCPPKQP